MRGCYLAFFSSPPAVGGQGQEPAPGSGNVEELGATSPEGLQAGSGPRTRRYVLALGPADRASWEGDWRLPSLGLHQDTGMLRGPDSPLLWGPGESGGSPAGRGGGGILSAGMGGSDPGWRLQSVAMGSAALWAEPRGTRGTCRAFCVPLHSGAFHGAQGLAWGAASPP